MNDVYIHNMLKATDYGINYEKENGFCYPLAYMA